MISAAATFVRWRSVRARAAGPKAESPPGRWHPDQRPGWARDGPVDVCRFRPCQASGHRRGSAGQRMREGRRAGPGRSVREGFAARRRSRGRSGSVHARSDRTEKAPDTGGECTRAGPGLSMPVSGSTGDSLKNRETPERRSQRPGAGAGGCMGSKRSVGKRGGAARYGRAGVHGAQPWPVPGSCGVLQGPVPVCRDLGVSWSPAVIGGTGGLSSLRQRVWARCR